MFRPVFLDTTIVVDYLRGYREAIAYVETLPKPLQISVVTVAELYAGVRDDELERLEDFIKGLVVVPLSLEAARAGGLIRRDYGPSHNTDLPDALIAATAEAQGARLITTNVRHFPMLAEVRAPYTR